MNKTEQREAQKRQHEYFLMEVRLTGEDTKTAILEKLDARLAPLEKRMSFMEIFCATITGGFAVVVAWLRKEGII